MTMVLQQKSVTLERKQRDVAILFSCGHDFKLIASKLEIGISTVYTRIKDMCVLVEVSGPFELLIWILQNPGCLWPGAVCKGGLHPQSCPCGSPYCGGMEAARLKRAA
jgi:DNA-binding CsgD family transcriptional regulator